MSAKFSQGDFTMKKIFALFTVCIIALGGLFAQETKLPEEAQLVLDSENKADTSTKIIEVSNTYPELHPVAGNSVKVIIEYTPMGRQIRIFYTCSRSKYDEGEALNTLQAVLDDFKKANNFYHVYRAAKDSYSNPKAMKGEPKKAQLMQLWQVKE